MSRLWFLLPLLPLLACQTPARSGAPGSPDPAKTDLQVISEAEKSGEVDADTAVLYRVYAVKARARLPERFRGGAPLKDATLVLRDAQRRYLELRPEVREELAPYLFPKGVP